MNYLSNYKTCYSTVKYLVVFKTALLNLTSSVDSSSSVL